MKNFVFVISLISVLMWPISSANAQFQPPAYAGIASFTIPCTCSGNLWIWFAPLYLGGPLALTGPMIYSTYSTILFAYYMIGIPGIWHLGSYIPAVPACWIWVPAVPTPFCAPLPAAGVMFLTGTNRFI
jgi:hypothetical protein